MSNNLDLVLMSDGQSNKEITHNEALGQIDAAITENFVADVSAGNVTLTDSQFRRNMRYLVEGAPTTNRQLVVPAIKKFFIVTADAGNTAPIKVARGSTTVDVVAGDTASFYCDGSTDGLFQTGGGGGSNPLPTGGTTGQVLTKKSGSNYDIEWADAAGGGGGGGISFWNNGLAKPAAADFTLVQAATGNQWQASDRTRGVYLTKATGTIATDHHVILRRPIPVAPYTVTACLMANITPRANVGLALFDADGKKRRSYVWAGLASIQGGWRRNNFSDLNVYEATGSAAIVEANNIPSPHGSPAWLRLTDDGTNITFYYSFDGENFGVVGAAESRTIYVAAPTYIGIDCWWSSTYRDGDGGFWLHSYEEA